MQAPPTPPIHGPITPNPAPIQPNGILTPDEFENLKRQIQLLRISQLRYIVKKYELPASGNKTRLVQIILHLFDAMRNTPLLSRINAEVLNIISSFHEPFTDPFEKKNKLSSKRPDSLQNITFNLRFHPFIRYPFVEGPDNSLVPAPPLLGPIYALPGISSGKFSFSIENLLKNNNDDSEVKNENSNNDNKDENNNNNNENNPNDDNQQQQQQQQKNSNNFNSRICIDFSWPNGEFVPFNMEAILNGLRIVISNDDPSPLPLDITDCCKSLYQQNPNAHMFISFDSVQTQTPMAISIREYQLAPLSSIASNILHTSEDSFVLQGNLKQPLPMNEPIQNWMEEFVKHVYAPK